MMAYVQHKKFRIQEHTKNMHRAHGNEHEKYIDLTFVHLLHKLQQFEFKLCIIPSPNGRKNLCPSIKA